MEGFEKWKEEISDEIRKMEPEDRLKLVSESIRAMVSSVGVGISYCIVDPGFGVKGDNRLASNWNAAPPKGRSGQSIIMELAANVSCMLESFMQGMRRQGVPDEKIKRIGEMILKDAVENFEKSGGAPEAREDGSPRTSGEPSPTEAEEA